MSTMQPALAVITNWDFKNLPQVQLSTHILRACQKFPEQNLPILNHFIEVRDYPVFEGISKAKQKAFEKLGYVFNADGTVTCPKLEVTFNIFKANVPFMEQLKDLHNNYKSTAMLDICRKLATEAALALNIGLVGLQDAKDITDFCAGVSPDLIMLSGLDYGSCKSNTVKGCGEVPSKKPRVVFDLT